MKIKNIEQNLVELILKHDLLISILKILAFTIKELDSEYFTRTGFDKCETQELLCIIENFIKPNKSLQKIQITVQQALIIRQSFVEILFAIQIKDYTESFGISEKKLNLFFESFELAMKANSLFN